MRTTPRTIEELNAIIWLKDLKITDLESQLSSAKENIEKLKRNYEIVLNNEKYYRERLNEKHLEGLKIHEEKRNNRLALESIKEHYNTWKNNESNKSNDVNFSFELHNIFAKLKRNEE